MQISGAPRICLPTPVNRRHPADISAPPDSQRWATPNSCRWDMVDHQLQKQYIVYWVVTEVHAFGDIAAQWHEAGQKNCGEQPVVTPGLHCSITSCSNVHEPRSIACRATDDRRRATTLLSRVVGRSAASQKCRAADLQELTVLLTPLSYSSPAS